MQRYLDHESGRPLLHFRAYRRLEAEGLGRTGWLEAWTELDNGVFRYDVTGEGGSEGVRTRVLRKVLESERQAWQTGEAQRSTITPANYEFERPDEAQGDLLKILLKPRRKGKLMVDGVMFLARDAAELVRVEGRLVSSPSFWVKHVDITRQYQRINGYNVPVNVDSIADLRLAGKAIFRMSYQYAQINGRETFAPVNTIASVGSR